MNVARVGYASSMEPRISCEPRSSIGCLGAIEDLRTRTSSYSSVTLLRLRSSLVVFREQEP